jgi:hypothetical protein
MTLPVNSLKSMCFLELWSNPEVCSCAAFEKIPDSLKEEMSLKMISRLNDQFKVKRVLFELATHEATDSSIAAEANKIKDRFKEVSSSQVLHLSEKIRILEENILQLKNLTDSVSSMGKVKKRSLSNLFL